MGLGTLYLLLTRQATLQDFVERVSKRVGIKGRAIVWPYAEPCMDVDKPNQLEMMRADLAKQSKSAAQKSQADKKPAAARKPAAKKKAPARKPAGKSSPTAKKK